MGVIEAKSIAGHGGPEQIEQPKPQPEKVGVLVCVTVAGVTPLEYTVQSV